MDGLPDNDIHIVVYVSGNYYTLLSRPHKYFFRNVHAMLTIFSTGCYGLFLSFDLI